MRVCGVRVRVVRIARGSDAPGHETEGKQQENFTCELGRAAGLCHAGCMPPSQPAPCTISWQPLQGSSGETVSKKLARLASGARKVEQMPEDSHALHSSRGVVG